MGEPSRALQTVIHALGQSVGGRLRNTALAVLALVLYATPVLAHGGPGIQSEPVDTPTWLFLLTGGGVIAVSFLLTSFVTDRDLLAAYHERRIDVPGGATLGRVGEKVGGLIGVAGLAVVFVVGVAGPSEAGTNLAVLLVWVLWWAGFTGSSYLLGNSWPAIDPFGRLAGALPESGRLQLPARVGRWPAVGGLLLLVWIEVVSDVATDPVQLALVAGFYALVSLAGTRS